MPQPARTPATAPASQPSKNGSANGPVCNKVKVPLSKMLGSDASKVQDAVAKHANDETRYGYINLPPGIDNGVAQLTAAYFSQYKTGDNAGKTFFRATGSVFEPLTATARDGSKMRVKGLQTTIQIPLFDQKNKKGEIYSDLERQSDIILNELRKLGGDTKGATLDDLEEIAETLVAAAPFFKFVTVPRIAKEDGNGFKKGDVTGAYENWYGIEGLEDYVPEETTAVVKDNTGPVAPKTAAATNGRPAAVPVKQQAPSVPQTVEESEPFVPETCEDLDILLSYANSDHELKADSEQRLKELGIAAGVSDKDQLKMNTWEEVVEAIRAASAGTEGGSGDENPPDGEEGLKVGDWVGFHPKNPVTKKKQKDAVRANVVAIYDDAVDLKVGKASYKKVPFDDLVTPPDEE